MSGASFWVALSASLAAMAFAWLRHRNRTGLRILVWHSISPTVRDRLTMPLREFARQLDWLQRRGYHIASWSEVLRRHNAAEPLPPRTVVLSFDDGCRSFLEFALPCLQERSLPSLVLVPVAVTMKGAGGAPGTEAPGMDLEQLRRLPRSVEVGLHSFTHCDYSRVGREAVRHDIARCAETHAWLGPRFVPVFAYPFGRFPRREAEFADMEGQLRAAGMQMALRLGYGVNAWPLPDPFRVRRICLHGTDGFVRFLLKLTIGRIRL